MIYLLILAWLFAGSTAFAETSADVQPAATSNYSAAQDPCADLPIGQTRRIDIPDGAKTTTLPAHYTIERLNDNTYKVHFNVRFEAGDAYAGPQGNVDKIYREKVRKCISQFNPRLESLDDPKTKQVTHLELDIDADSPQNLGAAAPISIGALGYNPLDGHRADPLSPDMENYPANISCQTVMHELLHRTGLVDEYNQGDQMAKVASRHGDKRIAMPCRAPGPETSIMVNEYKALLPASLGGYPLQPAHINAIVYAGCMSRNQRYYECAQLAYSPKCNQLPQECTMGADWLRATSPKSP